MQGTSPTSPTSPKLKEETLPRGILKLPGEEQGREGTKKKKKTKKKKTEEGEAENKTDTSPSKRANQPMQFDLGDLLAKSIEVRR